MRAFVLLLLALTSAWSAAATVTWEHPTTRVDGLELPIAEIAATRIEWAREGEPFADSLTVQAPATSAVVDLANPGRWCFRAYTIDLDGLTSDATTTLCVRVNAKPNAPSLISISP